MTEAEKSGCFIALAILFGSCILCSIFVGLHDQRETKEPTKAPTYIPAPQVESKPLINIPALANKSAKDVDAILGKPAEVTPTNDPGTTPGEFRDYKISGVTPNITSDGLMVRFYRDKAVHFTFDLPGPVGTPEDALLLAGIDVKGASPLVQAPMAKRWVGTFGGVNFKDAAALNLSDKRYNVVQAEVGK